MTEKGYKYFAFISYSHRDKKIARRLQRRLQGYHLPAKLMKTNPELPKRISPVFMDESNLVGSGTLREALYDNLDSSKYLIVICSPNSARSEYVNDEVMRFVEQGRLGQVVPLIVDGVPRAEDGADECFPRALLDLPREDELLGIDAQVFGEREAFLRVTATLLGLDLDNFVDYEKMRRRRKLAVLSGFAAVILFAAGVFAWQNIEIFVGKFKGTLIKARRGDVQAQFELAKLYYTGEGVEASKREAAAWCRKAADNGNAEAQHILGIWYEAGDGVSMDMMESVRLWHKAADQGYSLSQFFLGMAYYYGDQLGNAPVKVDKAEAVKWYRKAAEQNEPIAQHHMGKEYLKGETLSRDYAEAVNWLQKAVDNGYNMAEKDLVFARKCLSAEHGDSALQFEIGSDYAEDYAYASAVIWYRKAAEQGHVKAQFELGNILHDGGFGIAKDDKEAIKWWRAAAENGDPQAQDELGFVYWHPSSYSNAVKEDKAEAFKWYSMAAEQGVANSQHHLGSGYYYRIGLKADKAKGLEWWQKAAENGDSYAVRSVERAAEKDGEAAFLLGRMYEEGKAVSQDEAKAEEWFRKADKLRTIARARNAFDEGEKYYKEKDYLKAVECYERAAKEELDLAQFKLGYMYANGKGVEQDYGKALELYRKAAKQGNLSAYNNLGYMYENGQGVSQDYGKAAEFYRKAAEQGNATAQKNLQILERFLQNTSSSTEGSISKDAVIPEDCSADRACELGRKYYSEKDYDKAVKFFEWRAKKNSAVAQYSLGYMYYNGYGVKQDYAQAIEWYTKAAELGNSYAQYNLGYMYYNGKGTAQDYHQAATWYLKAAEQGNSDAQSSLGYMYSNGQGLSKDYAQAIEWYTKAAAQGYSAAQYNLGYMYYNGYGVKQDYGKAAELYKRAAEQGNIYAQNSLGIMYETGQGISQDYAQAVKIYTQAAEQGYSVAQYNLGRMYHNGKGTEQDYLQAATWYLKAAEQNNPYALYSLASLSEHGKGLTKDLQSAYVLYYLADLAGNKKASSSIKRLENTLTPSQLAEAKAQAQAISLSPKKGDH